MADYDPRAWEILVNDYQKLMEYVDPDDRNLDAYSHQIFELLCRVCIDFDHVCLIMYLKLNSSVPYRSYKNLKMSHFKRFFTTNHPALLKDEVGLLFWKDPSLKFISPLIDWDRNKKLSWFEAYNLSKHFIGANFSQASMKNLTLAISGLYLLLQSHMSTSFFQPYSTNRSTGGSSSASGVRTKRIDGQVFVIRTTV
ncbi:MAG: hypothetical protein HOE90_12975 [Bacteriovoracaceae bacterium]|jgi:hypothetical protein|nr:hypothetical protein [Bacteriovoracaceae bacterium]